VPVVRAPNLARSLSWLKEAGGWVVGADAAAPRSLYQTKLAPPVAMVLGGEGRGVRRLTRDLCDELVYIPMAGSVESLNVSVATGMCCSSCCGKPQSSAVADAGAERVDDGPRTEQSDLPHALSGGCSTHRRSH
jgi:tRNA G18 (ribose-2'-O)-methylase SpoU